MPVTAEENRAEYQESAQRFRFPLNLRYQVVFSSFVFDEKSKKTSSEIYPILVPEDGQQK